MSYNFYSFLHFASLLAFCLALGGLWGVYAGGSAVDKTNRRFLLGLHGLSIFLVFTAGFGLIAKANISFPWPFWVYIKLGVWLLLGTAPFFIRKASVSIRRPLIYWFVLLILFALLLFALFAVRLSVFRTV